MNQIKIHSTVYPPKQPSLIKWMQDFKIGIRIDHKLLIGDRASDMNRYYDMQKIKI
jgi:hypothetical protein